jgi:hypothetical protein
MASEALSAAAAALTTIRTTFAGVLYSAIIVGTGWIFGVPHILILLKPRLNVSSVEILKIPLVLIIITYAAATAIQWASVPPARSIRLWLGGITIGLLCVYEGVLAHLLDEVAYSTIYPGPGDATLSSEYAVLLLFVGLVPLLVSENAL